MERQSPRHWSTQMRTMLGRSGMEAPLGCIVTRWDGRSKIRGRGRKHREGVRSMARYRGSLLRGLGFGFVFWDLEFVEFAVEAGDADAEVLAVSALS